MTVFKLKKMFIYFWEREGERASARASGGASGGGAEREGDRIQSMFQALSRQHRDSGLEPVNREITTWAKWGA